MRDSARLASKQTETVWFSSAKRKPPSCEVLLQLQWAAESNLIKCSCKSNMKREKKKITQWKRFEKIKALEQDFFSGIIYFFVLQEEHVFSSETFRLFWGKNSVLIEIKTRGKRKWRLSFSGYDVVKCKHGKDWVCEYAGK